MDFRSPNTGFEQNTGQMPSAHPRGLAMATAALVLGILSLVSSILVPVYFPFLLGGLSLTLALLSRGSGAVLAKRAKAAIAASACSILFNLALLLAFLYLLFAVPEFRQEFDRIYQQFYGESFEQQFGEIYGISFDSENSKTE